MNSERFQRMSEGQFVGRYRILETVGSGGMGEVYRAHDVSLKRDVAIKVLPDAFRCDPERLTRFKREAHVLASLNHPNIATIYGFEESDDASAIVMEFVDGPTLADELARRLLPFDDTLFFARQIALALEAAHEQGMVHRDLKPANVKLRQDGVVKVLDFGLAKALEPLSGAIFTDILEFRARVLVISGSKSVAGGAGLRTITALSVHTGDRARCSSQTCLSRRTGRKV